MVERVLTQSVDQRTQLRARVVPARADEVIE